MRPETDYVRGGVSCPAECATGRRALRSKHVKGPGSQGLRPRLGPPRDKELDRATILRSTGERPHVRSGQELPFDRLMFEQLTIPTSTSHQSFG